MSPDPPFIDLSHTLDATTPAYPGDPPSTHTPTATPPPASPSTRSPSPPTPARTSTRPPTSSLPRPPSPPSPRHLPPPRPRPRPLARARARAHRVGRYTPARRAHRAGRGGAAVYGVEPLLGDGPILRLSVPRAGGREGARHHQHGHHEPGPSPHVGKDAPGEFLPSSSSSEGGFGAHRALLGAGCVIAENLTNLEALMEVQEGLGEGERLMVSLAPLKIGGCDGSPVRAFAWKA